MRAIKKEKYFIGGVTLLITLGFLTLTPGYLTHGNDPIPPVTITLLEKSADHLIITYDLHDFTLQPVNINDLAYYSLHVGDESNSEEAGAPNLPTICRSIIIPDQALMTCTVISSTYQDHENMLIAPARGDFTHNMNPDDIPYILGSIYDVDDWYPGSLATLHTPYILRDFRGQVIKVNPFQYNPVTQTLREYTSLTLEITAHGTGGENMIERDEIGPFSTEFQMIYERHFLNYEEQESLLESNPLYTPVGEIGNMLIITYDSFYFAMQPFVTWKNMKGIPTEMINVSSIGTGSANDIDIYIETYYNTNGLTFVLLVGDIGEVPALYYGSHASDPSYSYISGDNYPDLFVGRFSAQTIGQVETQVERSIEYERYPLANGTWYHNGTGIASSGGPGDDGEYNWEHMRYIRTDLLGYTYTHVDELYDGSQGGDDAPGNPTQGMVTTAVDSGRSIVNYCGNGGPTSWSTSGFNNTNINNLVNDNMLPYVVCQASNNGEFEHYDTCFAEAWMRATNNGEPTGAIGVYASTQDQSWSPPMDAQDEIAALLVETYPGNIKHTLGGLSYSGAMHMMDEYGSSCYDETNTWTVFGDPSLQIRTDTPTSLTVSHAFQILNGTTHFNVTVAGIEGALCALSQNGVLLGANYTDNTGYTLITTDPITNPIPVDLVVTAYNKIPYIAHFYTLYSGWNLVTMPFDNSLTAETLGENISGCTAVVMFDASTQTFLTHVVGVPHDDFPILDGVGYFIYCTQGSIFSMPDGSIASVTVPIYEEWNMVGWYHDHSTTAESLGENISSTSVVTMFDSVSQTFLSHVVGTPHDNFTITRGMGLFIYTTEGSIWDGTNGTR